MLTQDDLARLAQSLGDATVLSVYVDLTARDPAQKHAWRTQLADELRRIRDGVAAGRHDERAALARAAGHMEARLASDLDAGGARSWVAFATEQQVHHAESLSVHTPTVVAWGAGPRVAPYLRVLRWRRAVILAEVNAEGARLYRYLDGTLEPLERLRAHVVTDSHDHMGSMPRQGFHTGTRGATGTDAAQRELRDGMRRMLHELARHVVALAGAESWVVVGGTPVPARAALSALPEALATRTLYAPAMHIWASEAQIRDAAELGAAALQDAHDLAAVSAAVQHAARAGRGAAGIDATRRALASGAVEDLFLSERFLERAPDKAEDAVRAALGHGATPRVVRGDAADMLNETAQGIAARLRYVSVVA